MEWEPKLRTRYPDERAGVQIPRRHSNQAGGVRENRARPTTNQSTDRPVDDDIKIGVTMLESERAPHPEQRQNHKPESDARGDF